MNTYRIVIVDDEAIVRDAIRCSIPWDKYQIEPVFCAANAPEALEYLNTHEAELVLTDIRMPVIDGLKLVEMLRARFAEMDFIIISGYADFEYARQAMRFGARDYLLKPVDTGTLLSAVLKARDEWELQRSLPEKSEPHQPACRYSPTVTRLIGIIDEEIASEDLSLKWISREKMYLNENYLGKLFQKETGLRFTAYLYEQRMLLALRLMRQNPDVLIQEVAQRTGYGDNAQYFSIAFKKYTGLTPSEYRKKLSRQP